MKQKLTLEETIQALNMTMPAQTGDVVAAVKFVCDHAAEYGLDASRMAIMGESAGGFLTEFAATT